MKMDSGLETIGGRRRDNSHHFAAESEALDQIAKEVSGTSRLTFKETSAEITKLPSQN